MGFTIAIDGPAGAGKSTIAKEAAKRLNFIYVDTGAMYRALALKALREGVDLADEAAVIACCTAADVNIAWSDSGQIVLLDGEDVSSLIRQEQVSRAASSVAGKQEVRDHLTGLQRRMAESNDVLMDGRDIGTVILPHADVKIYLTASDEVRAQRRYREDREKGFDVSFEQVLADIRKRDHDDMTRPVAPLRQAENAVLLDTSDMTIEEAVEAVLRLVREKRNA